MSAHWRILDFAVVNLWRQKGRHALTVVVYGFVVFVLASVMLIAGALKQEARFLLSESPELIVQKMRAGRHEMIPLSRMETILQIRGVVQVLPRYWGYYFDPPPGVTYTVMGLDELPVSDPARAERNPEPEDATLECLIGEGVAQSRLLEPGDILPVRGSNGQLYVLRVTDLFTNQSALLTQDLIVLRTEAWRSVFDIPPEVATDLVVAVPNPQETETVARKIVEKFSDVRVVSRDDLIKTYDAVFDWRGGIVTLAFAGALAAFGIFAWDRAVGLSAEESRNLGILKAIGWDVRDVLELRLWEGLSLSLFAFLTGTLAAHVHVFHFQGSALTPFLKGWSALFPEFELRPHAEAVQFLTIFLVTVVPYVLVTLGPAWRAAVTDPEQAMRA